MLIAVIVEHLNNTEDYKVNTLALNVIDTRASTLRCMCVCVIML